MKKIFPIADYKIDELLKANPSEDYHWDENTIVYNGVRMTRQSVVQTMPTNKTTASSIIKKDPQFDYSYMDELYIRLDQMGLDHIAYAHITGKGNGCDNFHYQLDLYSAYPHIVQYEKMPVDGTLYMDKSKERLNFYLYSGSYLSNHCIITDDLKNYIEEHNLGECEFMFSTDYCVGCNMGKKLIEMVYKHKGTKADAKEVHWGYYQKRYLEYVPEEDAYAKRTQYNKEPLMIAIISQLVYNMLLIRDAIGDDDGRFVTDAYYFNKEPDLDRIRALFDSTLKNYDYRVIDATQKGTEDKHGEIMYKSYPDLPDAPRSHHKKKDIEVVYSVAKEAKIW